MKVIIFEIDFFGIDFSVQILKLIFGAGSCVKAQYHVFYLVSMCKKCRKMIKILLYEIVKVFECDLR
jgi:hypothetical protein